MIVRYGVPLKKTDMPPMPPAPPKPTAAQTAIALFEAAVSGAKPADMAVILATLLLLVEALENKPNAK